MAADGPGSMQPSRSVRPSESVTSSVPRRSLDRNPNASRTRRGKSDSTVSTLAGVTEINSDMIRSDLSRLIKVMRLCVQVQLNGRLDSTFTELERFPAD